MSKYNNRKRKVNGIEFDSMKEAARYEELCLLQYAGEISGLRIQPQYELQPKFKRGKKTVRAITYIADFEYQEGNKLIVEDVKGGKATQTPVFALKAKMFQFRYPHIELRITA